MKPLYSLILFFLVLQVQPSIAQKINLSRLVEQKRYTELQKRLEREKVDKKTKAIYQNILLNVFGKPARSNKMIGEVLRNKSLLSDSIKYMLLETQHDNFVKLFNYSKAYEVKDFLMSNCYSFYPQEKVEDEVQTLNLLKRNFLK